MKTARDYDAAFDHYAQGNALKNSQSRYDADHMPDGSGGTASKSAQPISLSNPQASVTRRPIRSSSSDCPAPDPRLLEQILSSHSQIDGTLELPNVLSLAQILRRRHVNSATPVSR